MNLEVSWYWNWSINPHISICQAERQIGIPRATIHRLLQSVQYYPYHITLVQKLSADDTECEHNYIHEHLVY